MYKYLICKKNRYLWLNIASAPAYVKFFNSLMTLDTITDTLWLRALIVTNQEIWLVPRYRPLTKLWEGYVFTGVCDSVHSGVSAPERGVCSRGTGVCSQGDLLRGGLMETPQFFFAFFCIFFGIFLYFFAFFKFSFAFLPFFHTMVNEQVVRILLECILVLVIFTTFNGKGLPWGGGFGVRKVCTGDRHLQMVRNLEYWMLDCRR